MHKSAGVHSANLRCVEDEKSKEMSWQSLNHPSTLRLITVLKHFGEVQGFSNWILKRKTTVDIHQLHILLIYF